MHAAADGVAVLDARLSKLAAGEPGRSLYTVAAASDGRLPVLGALATLARADEADHLRERLAYTSGRADALTGELKRECARAAIAEREASRARGELERQHEDAAPTAAGLILGGWHRRPQRCRRVAVR